MPRASRGTRRPRAERVVTTSAVSSSGSLPWQPTRLQQALPGVCIKTNWGYAGGGAGGRRRGSPLVYTVSTLYTQPPCAEDVHRVVSLAHTHDNMRSARCGKASGLLVVEPHDRMGLL